MSGDHAAQQLARRIVSAAAQRLGGALVTCAAAVALLPAPRPLAYTALIGAVVATARHGDWDVAIISSATAGVAWMWILGDRPFATNVSDQATIRLGFVLMLVCVSACALATRHGRRSRPARARSARYSVGRRRDS